MENREERINLFQIMFYGLKLKILEHNESMNSIAEQSGGENTERR